MFQLALNHRRHDFCLQLEHFLQHTFRAELKRNPLISKYIIFIIQIHGQYMSKYFSIVIEKGK